MITVLWYGLAIITGFGVVELAFWIKDRLYDRKKRLGWITVSRSFLSEIDAAEAAFSANSKLCPICKDAGVFDSRCTSIADAHREHKGRTDTKLGVASPVDPPSSIAKHSLSRRIK